MKTLVIGVGGIGARHLQNLKALQPAWPVACLRHTPTPLPPELQPLVAAEFTDLAAAMAWAPAAAIICSPATCHLATALPLAAAGVHLLVEKPLAAAPAGLDELIATAAARGAVLLVGHTLRFLPLLRHTHRLLQEGRVGQVYSIRAEVGQYLPEWRPGRAYQQTVTAQRALGGGVLLELCHELDYVSWLGGPVTAVTAMTTRVSALEIDVEDLAEVTLQFAGGGLGQVHLDMVQQPKARGCKVLGSAGTLTLDLLAHTLACDLPGATAVPVQHFPVAPGALLRDEMQHFLACIAGTECPCITPAEARQVVLLAHAAQRSAQTGMTISL